MLELETLGMYANLLLSILSLSLTCLVSGACWQRDGCFTDNSFNLENNLLRVVKKFRLVAQRMLLEELLR